MTIVLVYVLRNRLLHNFNWRILPIPVFPPPNILVAICTHVDLCHSLPPNPMIDVIDGRGLQIFLLHEDVSLQYYIPAVAR